jgi:inosose dehydratase
MYIHGFSSNLFGWRQRFKAEGREPAIDALLQECAAAGLDAIESDPAEDVSAAAARAGLRVSAHYVGLPLHQPWESLDIEARVLAPARRLAEAGGTELLVNADPKGSWASPQHKTNDDIRRQGENLARIAALAGPLGLRTAMHNHAAQRAMAEADLLSVVEFSSPRAGLCVDTGWAHTAGCDPVRWIQGYPQRIFAVHLRNQRGPVPTEDLLDGEIDLAAIVNALREIDYTGWLSLELWHRHDTQPQRTMVEDVRRSIEYLESLLGRS